MCFRILFYFPEDCHPQTKSISSKLNIFYEKKCLNMCFQKEFHVEKCAKKNHQTEHNFETEINLKMAV